MTHVSSGVAKYQAEQFKKQVVARWNGVMNDPRTRGREELAKTLLTIDDPNELSTGEILTALEKAPAPVAASQAASERTQEDLPEALQKFGDSTPTKGGTFDSDLYTAGEKSAKWLLGKV